MRKYTVKLNGVVIGKRQSARVYTHAVIGTRFQNSVNVATDGGYRRGIEPVAAEAQRPQVFTWCGRLELAHKAAAGRIVGISLRSNIRDIRVVPVEYTETKDVQPVPFVKGDRGRAVIVRIAGLGRFALGTKNDPRHTCEWGQPERTCPACGDHEEAK